MAGVLGAKTGWIVGGFRFGCIVVCGAEVHLAMAQDHAPWLSVGSERYAGSPIGQGQILVLHENGWHWLDPSSVRDRSGFSRLQETSVPNQRVDSLQSVDAVEAQAAVSKANWLGATIVGSGLVSDSKGEIVEAVKSLQSA